MHNLSGPVRLQLNRRRTLNSPIIFYNYPVDSPNNGDVLWIEGGNRHLSHARRPPRWRRSGAVATAGGALRRCDTGCVVRGTRPRQPSEKTENLARPGRVGSSPGGASGALVRYGKGTP